MSRFCAIYRDHISDRNPVREEVILVATSAEDALAEARKRASANVQLLGITLVECTLESDGPDDTTGAGARHGQELFNPVIGALPIRPK